MVSWNQYKDISHRNNHSLGVLKENPNQGGSCHLYNLFDGLYFNS